jgi:hypothetical protein
LGRARHRAGRRAHCAARRGRGGGRLDAGRRRADRAAPPARGGADLRQAGAVDGRIGRRRALRGRAGRRPGSARDRRLLIAGARRTTAGPRRR